MKNQTFTENFAAYFKKSYSKKMGGTQTVALPNGQDFKFDDREYYRGRGAKFNSSSMHENLGVITVTPKQVRERLKYERECAANLRRWKAEAKAKDKRVKEALKNGVYSLKTESCGTFVELSDAEADGKFFDSHRLAKTLGISIEDANLVKSWGKTYVFAKSTDGNTYKIYHAHLEINRLSISIDKVEQEKVEQFKADWNGALYAKIMGETHSSHFVC